MASKRKAPRLGAIHLRLTRAGWLFLIVAVLIGVASVRNIDSPLMFVMFGVMMGALMVSITLAGRTLAGVRVARSAPARTWQGQTVSVGYHVTNTRKGGSCLSLTVAETDPDGVQAAGGYCMHVRAGGRFRAGGRLTPLHRGRVKLQGVLLATTFPFGLVRARRRIRQPAEMVVWPARGRLRQRLLHRGAVETSSAPPSQVSGGSDEFFGLREYRPGDSPRWIHWRRSATRRAPVVREMARPLPEALWVIVDTHWPDASDGGQARRERVLRLAATLIDHAFVRGYQVGMALARGDGAVALRLGSGRGQRNDLLDALSSVDANTTVALDEVVACSSRHMLRQAQVVVLTPRANLPGPLLAGVRRSCRHLTVVGADRIDEVFADTTLRSGASLRSTSVVETLTEDAVCP